MNAPAAPRPVHLLAIGAGVLLLAWLAAVIYLTYRHAQGEARLLAQIETTQQVAWQAAQTMHHNGLETYFEEYVQQPAVLQRLRAAQDPATRDAARIDLYRYLYARYLRLQSHGLRQFHFVLPDGESFLRFHQPDRFGDKVHDTRSSFRIANTERRKVFGFEVGRITSGFRTVFPILDTDGTHLGAVELSVPFDVIRQEMVRLLPQREYQMLLRSEVVAVSLFPENQRLFAPWPGASRLMLEDPFGELPGASPPLSASAEALVHRLAHDERAQSALLDGVARSLALEVGDRFHSIALTPIADVSSRTVGFLASYAEEPALKAARRGLLVNIAFASTLLLLLGAAGYKLLRDNAIKLEERQRLQTINDTLGEGLYVMDNHGVIVHINQRACELLGYRPDELLGKTAHAIFHTHAGNDHLPLARCPIYTAVMAGHEFTARELFRRADGQIFTARVTSRPIVQPSGIAGSVTSFADVSDQVAMQEALSASEARYRSVVESVREVIFQTDAQGRWTFLNRAWETFTGFAVSESLHRPLSDFFHPDDRAQVHATLAALTCAGEEFVRCEVRYLCKHDSSTRWFELQARRLPGAEGAPAACSGTLADITERKRSEERLALAAGVFTHAREGIMITDAAGRIIDVNHAFTRITGYARDEVIGLNPRFLKSGRQPPEYYESMWRELTDNGYWDGEIWNRRKNGEVFAEMLTITAVRDAAGAPSYLIALFSDITTLKKHQQQLERTAHYDALTGLPNRVLLADRLQQAIVHSRRHGKPLAVLYLDLDGFKAINDTHGHEMGDELLIAISRRMKAAMREGDILARLGGDEFVAVLLDLEQVDDCDRVLLRLLRAASEPVEVAGITMQVSASIGVTLFPDDAGDADQLLRHADQAMYQAKQAGRNRYHFFDIEQDAAQQRRRRSHDDIREALASDQFVLHYQPKVNLRTGAVIGVEALVRWRHPQRGLLAPGEFLALVAEHGLSADLDEWVLDAALAQQLAWQAQGLSLPVSVNIGAELLQQADFPARLEARFARDIRLDPAQLTFEILETCAVQDMERVVSVMRACRQLGVSFALDDFGTGYSSLTYLRRLPAEQLKIDQSFVRDMLEDADDLAIVDGVVSLATSFRREVIAEGVETVEHGELLLPMGCTLGQGYGIARPMPGERIPGWIATWRPDPRWTAWQAREFRREDLPILFAEVEHRAWIRHLENCLGSSGTMPPPMDEHRCRFGLWFDHAGQLRHGDNPHFQAIAPLHRDIHRIGAELLALRENNARETALARLPELYARRDALIEQLHRLLAEA